MKKSIEKFDSQLIDINNMIFARVLETLKLTNEPINEQLLARKPQTRALYNAKEVIDTLRKFLGTDLEQLEYMKAIIFNDFDTLCTLFNHCELSLKEQFEIIIYFIEKNLEAGILTENNAIFYNIKNSDPKISEIKKNEENKKMFGRYYTLLNKDNKLTDSELKEKEELEGYLEEYKVDYSEVIEAHKKIKQYYIDNEETYSGTDVNIIVDNLKILGVFDDVCEKIKCLLNNEISKRKNKKEQINITFETEEDRKQREEEKKEIKKELNTYFDFKNMTSIRFLTMDEVLYVVSLLRKIKYGEDTIKEFLKINEYELNKQNVITKYLQLRSKLENYESKYAISEELNNLDSYFKELFIACDDDYNFWKNLLNEELTKVLKYIPNTYEYELNK